MPWQVRIADVQTGAWLHTGLPPHSAAVTALAAGPPGGSLFLSASHDSTVRLWNWKVRHRPSISIHVFRHRPSLVRVVATLVHGFACNFSTMCMMPIARCASSCIRSVPPNIPCTPPQEFILYVVEGFSQTYNIRIPQVSRHSPGVYRPHHRRLVAQSRLWSLLAAPHYRRCLSTPRAAR